MPTTVFSVAASADDGSINKYDDSVPFDWPPTATTEDWAIYVALDPLRVGSSNNGSATEAQVGYIRFNTATLPDDAIVSQAVLKLHMVTVNNADTRNLNVEWYTPASWPPNAASDHTASVGTTAGAFAISGMTAGVVSNLTLSSPTAVSLVGYTSFRLGVSGGTPSGVNQAYPASFDGSDPEAQLEVVWESYRRLDFTRFPRPVLRTRV